MTNTLGSTDVVFTIQNKDDLNVGLIVGATIGAVAAAVLLGVAIYFIVNHENKKKVQYHRDKRQENANGNAGTPADEYAKVDKHNSTNKEHDNAISLEDVSKQKGSKSEDSELQYAELPALQKQSLKQPRVEASNTIYSQINTRK